MNATQRYAKTVDLLATTRRQELELQESHRKAQEVFAKQEEKLKARTAKATAFYAQRLQAQKEVIVAVISKHNHGRLHQDTLVPAGYEWAFRRGTVEIVRLTADTVTFRIAYRVKPNQKLSEESLKEYTVKRDLLSLSNRALASEVRVYIKRERARRDELQRTKELAKLREEKRKVTAAIEEEKRKLAQLKRDQERLASREERLAARPAKKEGVK